MKYIYIIVKFSHFLVSFVLTFGMFFSHVCSGLFALVIPINTPYEQKGRRILNMLCVFVVMLLSKFKRLRMCCMLFC